MKKVPFMLFLFIFLSACSGAQESRPTSTFETTEITSTSPATISPIPDNPTMTPTKPLLPIFIETVTFTTVDGINLAGTLFGEGEIAIILAHQGTYGVDQSSWHPFARLLAENGYTALTFDFRGMGQSGGKLLYGNLEMDVAAAAEFLQDRGYKQIACIGASMGGTACIRAAQNQAFAGLVVFASTMMAGSNDDDLHVTPDDLKMLTQPKLFISASNDIPIVVNDTKRMYELSPEQKDLILLRGTKHGTDLFRSNVREELITALFDFLERISNSSLDSIPALQPITIEYAEKIQLLRTMKIPDYNKGQVSQCSLAFSPDNRLIVGACGENQVPVWDVQTGSLVHTLYDAPVHIVACAFSPDGSQIACGGFDKTVTRWDTVTGKKIDSYEGQTAPIWDIDFDPAGKLLASCSLGLFGGGPGQGKIHLWNTENNQLLWDYSGDMDYLSLSFHPSGKLIAYGSIGGSVGILDTETGKLLVELTDSARNIGDVAYSPSGLWLAAGSDDHTIYLWDASSYELSARLKAHTGYVNGVAFNPDETLLASGSHDKTVGIWNLTNQSLITQLTGHEGVVLRVAFSPDGTMIASISWDGTVRLWGVSIE